MVYTNNGDWNELKKEKQNSNGQGMYSLAVNIFFINFQYKCKGSMECNKI